MLCGGSCYLKNPPAAGHSTLPLRHKPGCKVLVDPKQYPQWDASAASQQQATTVAVAQQVQTGSECQVVPGREHPGGDLKTVKVGSVEACCRTCDMDPQCVSAAFCGGDTCFMKDRTAAPEVENPQCTAVIAKPELLDNPWLPNDVNVEELIEAMPDNTKNKHKHGAWELLKQRIRYSAHTWSKMDVKFPSLSVKPVRILILNSPCVLYGMDWHTGEHLQWGDIIYTLVRLGHKVYVAKKYQWKQWKSDTSQWDVILTDYGGVSELWRARDKLVKLGTQHDVKAFDSGLTALRCKLRVLDTFGTSEEFNALERPKMTKKMPPALGIRLDQYWGYYPQVGPRSTFIGFTITDQSGSESTVPAPKRTWKAVLWGKHPSYMGLERNAAWLRAISKHVDIVATIDTEALESADADSLPDFVQNRGVLELSEYYDLLRSSALIIGVGQPFWGNAPLDALLQGVMTLMPSFHPPLGHCNECSRHFPHQDIESKEAEDLKKRFDTMPNRFPLSSQNPYLEGLGEPDVYLLSEAQISDPTSVEETLSRAKAEFERRQAAGIAFPSRLPDMWTPQAFVDRLSDVMQNILLCGGAGMDVFPLSPVHVCSSLTLSGLFAIAYTLADLDNGYSSEAAQVACWKDTGPCNVDLKG